MLDIEWKNIRAAQSYPLDDIADGISEEGAKIPQSFILDISINLPPSTNSSIYTFFINKIIQADTTYNIYIANKTLTGYQDILKFTVSKECDIGTPLQDCFFNGVNVYEGEQSSLKLVQGSCIIGITRDLNLGTLTFSDQKKSLLNLSCIHRFQITGIEALKVNDSLLSGIVQLKGQNGILIEADIETNTIKISVDHSYLQQQIDRYKGELEEIYGKPIKTINGIQPNETGDFTLTGLDCISISASPTESNGTLIINNPCGKPCCDITNDTNQIQTAIVSIKQQMQRLKEYYSNQAIMLNFMQTHLSTLLAQGIN